MHAHPLYFILLLIGAICFALAAVSVPVHPRINLVALGLLAWVLVPLLTAAQS